MERRASRPSTRLPRIVRLGRAGTPVAPQDWLTRAGAVFLLVQEDAN